ncbi:cytochrome P450 [Flavobacterium pectinovorum]|uniref:cytochrome P450 n=1 Tax=Flavobacterium pectinovorum TaxID=29533 RepID=UPI00265F61BA|nr:cytochrome P450 [Flavobacterium pectinovorum]WKL45884.1 cytochrome P450 [Flavobacterium pectinovorum]
MSSSLFFQSDVKDPYSIYKLMLDKNPVYWDETNQIWAIYSYEYCVEILKNAQVEIPIVNPNNEQKLNKSALEILNNLTRLSNGIQHEITREIALLLFSNIKFIAIDQIISQLIQKDLSNNKIDWVNSICKKLPILSVLKSFDFGEKDCDFITEKIDSFSKIMLPKKTEDQVKLINENAEKLYSIIEKHLSLLSFYKPLLIKISEKYSVSNAESIPIVISNFIGLCIQSSDAGRGILSNSLLQIINNKYSLNKTEIEKAVIETLRFDPPIHNTRRVSIEDFYIGESQIKKNDSILIVLASANRDSQKFENAMDFSIERFNNHENLTFGIGGHMCLAKYFSINLATEALSYLVNEYKTIALLENKIEYEPLINARLPKNIWIRINN